MRKRVLSILLTVAMVLTLLPATAQAAPGSDFTVTGDPSGYTYGADGKLTFTKPGNYTVAMAATGSAITMDTIVVDANESATDNPVNITLQDVSINVSSLVNACTFDIKDGSTVSLTLRGTNTLTSGYNTAGLRVPLGATLIIDGDGMLTATGGGSEQITKNYGGAGIGSSTDENSGAVIIKGGTIIANGAQYSAGIGGGYHGTSGTVDISGGTVTAYGKNGSAGIGAGSGGDGGTINISGGTVIATGYSVGIGSTSDNGFGTINISGGIVTATSLSWGSGIGTGAYYTGTDNKITISGGTVNAIAGTHGAGIGGGFRGNGGTILITGGTVTAQGGKYGAGIGGGRYDNTWSPDSYLYNITISGGTVNATGGLGGAGIGGGFDGKDGVDVSGGTVNISGGTITAVGGDAVTSSTDSAPTNAGGGGAGIGGGTNGGGGSVYISGGSVKAVHGTCSGTGASAKDIGKGYSGVSDGYLKNFDTAEGEDIYLTELTLGGVSTETAVSSVITETVYTYSTSDMQTDSSGKLYLYLPAGSKTTSAVTLPLALTYKGEVMTTTNPATSYGTLMLSADVDTYIELTAAIADANIGTINVIGNFALEDDVTIDRTVTISSANGSVISTGPYSLLVSGAANVTMSDNLTVTGSGTVISVGADSSFVLNGGMVLANGDNSCGIFLQSKGEAYIQGDSVSAVGENAYGILIGWGDYKANLYIDMSNSPSIDEVYYFPYDETTPDSYITSFPTPFSAVLEETSTVTLTGGVDFDVRTILAGSPGSSLELNAKDVIPYDNNVFEVTPNTVGTYSLVLLGSMARSNVFIIIPVTVTSGFAGGDGTAGNPFQIANIEQLNRVRKFLGSSNTNKYFILTENIDLGVAPYNTGEGWEPIGNNIIGEDKSFQGNFDGNGKTISGLFINREDGSIGLFGACSDAGIENLYLSGVNITGDYDNAGSLTGYLGEASAVTNCYATGTVTSGTVGGLVGAMYNSTIRNSYTICSVTGNVSGGLVGGMGGISSSTNSYAVGSVNGSYAGGLVGDMRSASSITSSYAACTVTGTSYAGGLVGYNESSGTVAASYYNSQASGQSDDDDRGEPRTSMQMLQETTFSGWDFTLGTGEWVIIEGVSYPYLQALVPNPLPAPPAVTSARIVEDYGDSRYDASTKTLTLTYGDDLGVCFSAEDVTPVAGLVTWSNSDSNVVDIFLNSDGSIEIGALGAGTATISLKSSDGTTLDSITVIVEPIPLTVTGDFEVEDKEYDGSINASITNTTLSLDTSDCVFDDADNLTANFVAVFSDPDVGQDKTVGFSDSCLTGSAAGNYVLDFSLVPESTATITPKELTIGGSFTVQGKAYSGTTDAVIDSNNLTLIGRVGSDDVTLVPVLAFDTPDIATGKTVYLTAASYLKGAKAGNYTLSINGAPTYTMGVITNKQVTLGGGFTVNNKEYSGDKVASINTNNLTLVGVNPDDDVSIESVTAEFDSAIAGKGKTVRVVGFTLTGADVGNYTASLTSAPTSTADITAKPMTISGGFTVKDKQYDGTVKAEIDTNSLILNGFIGIDAVSLNVNVAFSDANVGTDKTVTLTGSTLMGTDATNYVLDLTGAPVATANITKATGLLAPPAPTLHSKTSTSVTLIPKAVQEFSIDNGVTWQTSNVFTGLTPSTEYSFITRINEDSSHEASPASAALKVTTNTSSSSGGGTPAQSTPPSKIRQATVYGVSEDSVNVVSTVGVARGVTGDEIVDAVVIDQAKTEEVIQKVLKQKNNKIQIVVDELENDKADRINFIIKKEAVKKFLDSEIALELKTEAVSIDIPKESVQAISEDGKVLFFRITPINNKDKKTAVVENAITAKVIQNATGGGEVVTLGTPMMIETNYQGYSTKLVFSLKDITIPEDETQRALFLSGLGVYINHSDKEQEFKRGTIIYDSDGNPVGIEIEISKFSTFTMISIINEAPVASDLIIIGKAKYGNKITASYSYNDKEQDEEGKSLISWYRADSKKGRNKKLVAEGKLKYKIVKADQGKYLIVEITPVASTGELMGSTVSAYVKVAANEAPKAISKKISGKTVVGSKLTLKYTYYDSESDKEGKITIQWYRADSADGAKKQKIKNANKRTYTLTKADFDKYIIVEIKPVAKTGSKTGTKTTVAIKTSIKQK